MYQLVSTDDLNRRMVFPLVKIKTVLGRDTHCDIVLDDIEVSRMHTKIYIINNQVQVKDMQSRNGTYLNNQPIDKMTETQPGDQIIIGPNLFCIEKVDSAQPDEVELTCMLTVHQLRDLADKEIPERPDESLHDADVTLMGSKSELIAGIYKKKIGLARHPSLEILFGQEKGRKFLLPPGDHTLGRGETANIRLLDEKISSLHGKFVSDENGVKFIDENSLNGSILNNRVVIKARLEHRDTLMLGKTKIRFLDPKRAPLESASNSAHKAAPPGGPRAGSGDTFIAFAKSYWLWAAAAGAGLLLLLVVLLKP